MRWTFGCLSLLTVISGCAAPAGEAALCDDAAATLSECGVTDDFAATCLEDPEALELAGHVAGSSCEEVEQWVSEAQTGKADGVEGWLSLLERIAGTRYAGASCSSDRQCQSKYCLNMVCQAQARPTEPTMPVDPPTEPTQSPGTGESGSPCTPDWIDFTAFSEGRVNLAADGTPVEQSCNAGLTCRRESRADAYLCRPHAESGSYCDFWWNCRPPAAGLNNRTCHGFICQ